ncbi:hypothetical protein [Candidatus Similichlamydia epinepheli]|uniref:hypothetical protein n=1 Tax=Candidatus Similichlamydia epinepheli TaxID=1903953 RepID=UPI000D398876|nr:hypothetical protein [Candidatus Similichlamydia epinepheli]
MSFRKLLSFLFLCYANACSNMDLVALEKARLHKSHNCSYAVQNCNIFYDSFSNSMEIISLPGLRIRSIASAQVATPFHRVRVLAKVSLCLRASDRLGDTSVLALVTRCVLGQSWCKIWWETRKKNETK